MPASPEVGDAGRDVRIVEVFEERKAKELAQADRHVSVAGEVEVDLQRIADQAEPSRAGRECRGINGKDRVGIHAECVGENQFLRQADD